MTEPFKCSSCGKPFRDGAMSYQVRMGTANCDPDEEVLDFWQPDEDAGYYCSVCMPELPYPGKTGTVNIMFTLRGLEVLRHAIETAQRQFMTYVGISRPWFQGEMDDLELLRIRVEYERTRLEASVEKPA
jgi:hypothetical protein